MFRRKKKAAPPVSPARQALLAADAALAEGRSRLAAAQQHVERLKAIADAAGPADAALRTAVASDGGEELARLSRGETSEISGLADAADAAKRAAGIALSSLPAAEAELKLAGDALADLETAKRKCVGAVLAEQASELGERYLAAFQQLAAVHDEIVGVARVAASYGRDLILTTDALEAPRFALKSMPQGETFSRFLRHVPRGPVIDAVAGIWSRAAQALSDSPTADIAALVAAATVEPETAPRPVLINLPQRRRPDDDLSVDEVLWGHDQRTADRRRVHQILGDVA
jgi:hypothetical protein